MVLKGSAMHENTGQGASEVGTFGDLADSGRGPTVGWMI
jgi:hypothetical protein